LSKLIVMCSRQDLPGLTVRLRGACDTLLPDNIMARPPQIVSQARLATAVINPSPGLQQVGASICLGRVLSDSAGWDTLHAAAPEGSYAICRAGESYVELLTDFVGSRVLWYYFDDDLLLASSSQRALTCLLGSLEVNRAAIPWLLSSGTPGPEAWDRRFHRLGPDSRLTLDRRSWTISIQAGAVEFKSSEQDEQSYAKLIEERLAEVCEGLQLPRDQWHLPLSGGADSRALLLFMSRQGAPDCITWGRASAVQEPGSDAYVAQAVARKLGVKHQFFPIDYESPDEPLRTVIDRFLTIGEGSIDHLSGYMDGFAIWRSLYEAGIGGVIRGDEGFGIRAVTSEDDARYAAGAVLLTDYFPDEQIRSWEFPAQHLPHNLERRASETLATWRDRLYQGFRIPVMLAALNELKSPYVEIVNPLLCRRIIELARTMPDKLRTNRNFYRKLISKMGPRIPFATHSAIAEPKQILGAPMFVDFMREGLGSASATGLLPAGLLHSILRDLRANHGGTASSPSLLSRVKQKIPRRVLMIVKRALPPRKPPFNANVLAFRAIIAARTLKMLEEDARRASKIPLT
jgi:asparagine synthetase B (glutamine-hydrolysing)